MPHCPNCGDNVNEEHHYCGQCGYPLSEVTDETDKMPPSGTAASRRGFLSGRSSQYLTDVLDGERELNSETVGYANLSRDVGAALADFARVASVADLNLLALALHDSTETTSLTGNVDELDRRQLEERMMWTGFLEIPALYDRAFETAWAEELTEELDDLIEKAITATQDQ